jgi:hypothetical protein
MDDAQTTHLAFSLTCNLALHTAGHCQLAIEAFARLRIVVSAILEPYDKVTGTNDLDLR